MHLSDCYICCTKSLWFSNKNKKKIINASVSSVIRPLSEASLVPRPTALHPSEEYIIPGAKEVIQKNDLIRDLIFFLHQA